jgi:hypothetical protein
MGQSAFNVTVAQVIKNYLPFLSLENFEAV